MDQDVDTRGGFLPPMIGANSDYPMHDLAVRHGLVVRMRSDDDIDIVVVLASTLRQSKAKEISIIKYSYDEPKMVSDGLVNGMESDLIVSRV